MSPKTPIIRDFRELTGYERLLALATLGASIKIQFIVDEFLQHDPHTQMYLAWLEDAVWGDIRRGVDITLEIKRLMDADSVVDVELYRPKETQMLPESKLI